jgi:signal transduction histidine kinase
MAGMTLTAPAPAAQLRGLALPAPVACGAALLAVCVAAGVALHAANAGTPLASGVTDFWLMPLVGGAAFGGAGLWLLRARPRFGLGRLFTAIGLVLVTSNLGVEVGVRELGAADEGWARLAFWYGNWAWATCLLAAGTILPLLLPDGRLPSRRWRPALVLSAAAVALVTVQWALTPYASWSPALERTGVENPLAADWVSSPALGRVALLVYVSAAVTALSAVGLTWRRATAETRRQLAWVGLGAAAGLVAFALGFALGPLMTALALVPLPAACVVAALRHGLWDVDVVLSRSLAYATLTALVVAVYAGAVALLGALLEGPTRAPVTATALAAVAVLPLHRRVQTLVNRLVHGQRDEPFVVLSRLGEQLEAARDDVTMTDEVLPTVVETVARSLRLPYAAVVLDDGALVEAGTRSGAVVTLPLSYAGRPVGSLLVSPPPGGFTRPDRAALDALAGQAAVALHTVSLGRQVRRSREEAVVAREEERRRLYRDLHDGLGPSVAALALQVEAARHLMPQEPERADRMLGVVLARLRGTVDDVRTVVHGLRPPALDDLGLPQAVHELASQFRTPGTSVDVRIEALGELPAAVEVAAYAVVGEALTNAARHAGASTVSVTVAREHGSLVVTVRDDGRGADRAAVPGVGLVSMRRRAEELGGTLAVGAPEAGSGTVVQARLPVPAP